MIASVKMVSSVLRFVWLEMTSVSTGKKLYGHGLPVIIGKTFGWFRACNAAKTPVGRISASMRRELSAIPINAVSFAASESELDHDLELVRLKSVPPALGTRTYCAWPPSRTGLPNSAPSGHLQVNPRRQKLHGFE